MTDLRISDRVKTRIVDVGLIDSLRTGLEGLPAVASATLMGSRSRDTAHAQSNIDVQMVIDRLNADVASGIARSRDRLVGQLGIPISVNVHTMADADPALGRYELFQHKNRAELFIYQAKYTGIEIFGKNVFTEFADPAPSGTRREAIRTVASFSYFLRKLLFDVTMAPHGAAEFVRTPLISLEYIAAFYGYLSMGHNDGLDFLSGAGRLLTDDIDFLRDCAARKLASRYQDIGTDFALQGTAFLDRVHKQMLHDYRRRGISDVRWDGKDYAVRWCLDYPQAASMTVITAHGRALLLQRPHNDYLYPGQWTIPGGYLQPNELAADAALREVWEETGSYVDVRELFGGQPVISPRLAAFVFSVELPAGIALRLTEHASHRFVDLRSVLSMNLTPEARMIFDRFLA